MPEPYRPHPHQINLLQIKRDKNFEDKWQVDAPDGRVLQDRLTYQEAIDFATVTTDFLKVTQRRKP